MSRWLVRLAGALFDLEELPYWFPDGRVRGVEIEGQFYLVGEAFERLSEASDVRTAGLQALDEFSGVIAALNSNFERPRIDAVFREEDDGRRHAFVILEAGVRARSKVRASPSVQGLTSQPLTQAQVLLAGAKADRHLETANALWADPTRTWPRLYRVLEEIEQYLGGTIDKHGIATASQRERFTRTANTAEVSGHDSRHALGRFQPPTKPMTLTEATEFIAEILRAVFTRSAEASPLAVQSNER